MPKKRGRPNLHTDQLAAQICARIATGESLRKLCEAPEMPSVATVMRWLFDPHPAGDPRLDFREQYAREAQAELLVDEMIEIADDDAGDVLRDLDGNVYGVNNVRVNRHKLRLDIRKWYASKVLPRFADKVTHEGGDKPIEIEAEVMDDRELARQVALILYRADPKRLTHQKEKA